MKNLSAKQETWVRSLDREDPLEEGMAIHSSTLAWRIPWTEGPGGLLPWGHKESDMAERLMYTHHVIYNIKENRKKVFLVIKTLRIHFQPFSHITSSSINYICQVIHYILSTSSTIVEFPVMLLYLEVDRLHPVFFPHYPYPTSPHLLPWQF